MSAIAYVTGDAANPKDGSPLILAHIVNDAGAMGKGFVVPLCRRWPDVKTQYRRWYKTDNWQGKAFCLGEVQFLTVSCDITVANMVAQHGLYAVGGKIPLHYPALRFCLARVAVEAKKRHCGVHMPRIGCGLAGGKWENVEMLVRQQLCDQGVAVTVYDLPK